MDVLLYKELSDKIIGCAITVNKIVGPGFLEHVYEESLCVELKLNGMPYTRQKVYSVFYKGYAVGKYVADIVVKNRVIVELKVVPAINNNMIAQLINYLHVSKIHVGYIINFRNAVIEFRRFVL